MPLILLFLAAVTALTVAACSIDRIVYPGDGRLVIVKIDQDLDNCPVTRTNGTITTVGAAVREGIRYWDVAGVRLRTPDQLVESDRSDIMNAPLIRAWSDDPVSAAGTNVGTHGEQVSAYRHNYGDIKVHLSRLQTQAVDDFFWTQLIVTFAHETGHAIGLDHVPEFDAVMFANATWQDARSDLSLADLREHARVWP